MRTIAALSSFLSRTWFALPRQTGDGSPYQGQVMNRTWFPRQLPKKTLRGRAKHFSRQALRTSIKSQYWRFWQLLATHTHKKLQERSQFMKVIPGITTKGPCVDPGNLIRTSIHYKYSGSMKTTAHMDHISHCKTTSGTDWSNRWTYRVSPYSKVYSVIYDSGPVPHLLSPWDYTKGHLTATNQPWIYPGECSSWIRFLPRALEPLA